MHYLPNERRESMAEKRKIEALHRRVNTRNDEFMKYLQKRMKELEMEEKKFREDIIKERKQA